MKNMKTNKITGLLAGVILILASCGTAGLSAPTGLLAADSDPDNPNRVQISWLPVDGADIYYVYRDTAADGTFSTNAGFSVTSAEDGDGVLRYNFMETFDEGDGGTYYYRVTSDILDGLSVESAMSAAVAASTYSGTWSAADASIIGTAAQLSLASGTASLYAVYGSSSLSAKEYAEDADSQADDPPSIWTSLTGSPGTTAGITVNDPPAFSSFISGSELYTAFSDSDQAGKVTMRYYHDSSTGDDAPSFAWTAAGAAGFNDAAVSNITTATVGFGGDIYSAFMETSDAQMYKNNVEIDLSVSITDISSANNLFLLTHSNAIYLGYEYSDGLYCREFDSTFETLAAGGLVTASDIDDGNAVFVSGGGDLYAVYIVDGGGLKVGKYENSSWSELTTISTAPDNDKPGTLAAHWYNGYLYIFYVGSDGKGWVKYYDEDDGWQNAESGGLALTSGTTGLGSFQLVSAGTELYAGYIEDGSAYVRILK